MIYYIGYTSVAAPEFQSYVSAPKAPKNYKDPKVIEEYLEKAYSEIRSTASSKPITSLVTDIHMISSMGETFDFSGGNAAHDFVKYIGNLDYSRIRVYGFNAKNFMRSVSAQVIKECPKADIARIDFVYYWLFCDHTVKNIFMDPTRVFLSSADEQSRISLSGIFKYFGLDLSTVDLSNTKKQSEAVRDFCAATGLDVMTSSEVRDDSF